MFSHSLRPLLTAFIVASSFLTSQATEIPADLFDDAQAKTFMAETTTAKYPNADSVLVYDVEKSIYQANGTSVNWDNCYEKILTEKGRRENKVMSFHYSYPYSTVKVHKVDIIKKNGTVVPVDIAKNSKEMIDRSQMSQNIYNPNDKILKVTIPQLEIGDTIHYIWQRNTVKARVPNTWSNYQVFEYTNPIRYYKVIIDGPKELPLRKIELKDEIQGSVVFAKKSTHTRNVYTWTAQNVGQIYPEPNMPSYHTVTQRLLVSTIPNWEYISKWYWELCKPHIEKTTPDMERKVKELTSGLKTEMDKIMAIFQFVSQEIRYMGITTEKEAPGYEPHDIDVTFNNRYGVCRDKAALLVGMLRLAGLKAYPVIINNGPKKDIEVPQPYFNHAVSCVETAAGKYILMDSTDETTKRLFPAYLSNRSYLVAKPEGETLLTSNIIPARENMMHLTTKAKLVDNILQATTDLAFEGYNDNVYRGYFLKLQGNERHVFFERHLKRLFPGAELTSVTITPENLQDMSAPLKVSMTYTASPYAVTTDSLSMISPVMLGNSFGMANFVLNKTSLKERRYPLITDVACGIFEKFTLELDKPLELISIPKYESISSKKVQWDRKVDYKDNILSGQGTFKIKAVEFDQDDYLRLKNNLKTIEYNKRKKPILSSYGVPTDKADGDAEIVSEVVDIIMKSNSEWRVIRNVKKKINTYKGKKDNAELIVNYNPAWESVILTGGRVTTGDKVSTLSDEETHLMDARWVGSAPGYPAGKTLVANFPGVEKGSIIEYTLTYSAKNKPFFSMREYLQQPQPIRSKKITITRPLKLPMYTGLINKTDAVKYTEKATKSAIIQTWEIENSPSIKAERSVPARWNFAPVVFASTGDKRGYAAALRDLFQTQTKLQPKAAALATKLTTGLENPLEKVRAIRDQVAKTIRTTGPGFTNIPLDSLHTADEVLTNGYGNRADRGILLYSMLKSAGFSPRFLIGSNLIKTPSIADAPLKYLQRDIFSKILIEIQVENRRIILNDTTQYDALGASPFAHKLCLDITGGTVEELTPDDQFVTKQAAAYTFTLDSKGNAHLNKTRTLWGAEFGKFNGMMSEMLEEKRKRYDQKLISQISHAAVLKGPVKAEHTSYPAQESYDVEIPQLAVRDEKFLYFELPVTFLKNALPVIEKERTYGFKQKDDINLKATYTVNLPSEMTVPLQVPPEFTWESPAKNGSISISSTYKNGKLTISYNVDLHKALYTPDMFETIKDAANQLADKRMTLILFGDKTLQNISK